MTIRASSLAVAAAALLAGAPPASAADLSLRFIGQQILSTATTYAGTQVGGLSGIDFVGGTGFIAISDDRSQINPARFYSLSLALSSTSFAGVTFTGVTTLQTPGGGAYPALAIDPEAIRRLPDGNIIYSSEGDKTNNINAFIREGTLAGGDVADFAVPASFQQTGPSGTTGVRNNLAFESLAVSPDGSRITTATENALLQDGPAAGFGVGSPSRLLTFDRLTRAAGAQYVYNVAPITDATTPPGQFSTGGLVELLDLGSGRYIAVERSFVTGLVTPTSSTGNSIQLYLIDLAGATDVSGFASLAGQSYTPVGKTLLFDLDDLGIPLDNIEGISFGQTLENGHRSLILVSDNNFAASQFTQFLAFDVAPVPEPASWALLIGGFGVVGGAVRRRARIAPMPV